MEVKIEQIRDGDTYNLSISWDSEDGVVLLFTPDMDDKMDHHHIELNDAQAAKLRAFLNDCPTTTSGDIRDDERTESVSELSR